MLSKLILLIFLSTYFGIIAYSAEQTVPAAVINLLSWDREARELDASYRVFDAFQNPNTFLSEQENLAFETAPIITPFSGIQIKSRKISNQDSIAFAILLRNLPKGVYGLRMRVDTAAEVFLIKANPKESDIQNVLSIGRAGVNAKSSVPEVADRLGRFEINDTEEYWLLINVANFHYKDGSIWKVPVIGDYNKMQRSWIREALQGAFVIGIIFILTIYNFALFIYRPEEKAYIWLAINSCINLLRYISMEGVSLPIFFPVSSATLHSTLRLMELGFSPLASATFVNFIICNFASWEKWRLRSQIFLGAAIAYIIVALALPTAQLPNLIITLDLFYLVCMITTLYILTQAVRNRMMGSITNSIGISFFVGTIIFDILAGLKIINSSVYVSNIGAAILIFFQSQVIAKLFAQAFRTSKRLSAHLEVEVEFKTRDIQSLLDNIPLGICSIDINGLILPNYSIQFPSVIGFDSPASRELSQVLFDRSQLNSDTKDMAIQSLKMCIGENILNFQINEDHLPANLQLLVNKTNRYLQCIWSPITNKLDIVERIMLVLRDVTALREAEERGLVQQIELEYIIELVNVSADKFDSFCTSSLQFLAENDRLLRKNIRKDEEIIKIIFVNMHTIKGGARTLGFHKMTTLVHDVEQDYAAMLKNPNTPWNHAILLEQMDKVKASFDTYFRVNHEKLGRISKNSSDVTVSRELLEHQDKILRSISTQRLDPDDVRKLNSIALQIESICFSDASDVFLDILSNVKRVAKDLGKEIPIINVQADGFRFKHSAHELLEKIFVHIIRNSLDHGIETSQERMAIGKTPTGRIDVILTQQGQHLDIRYFDDGRGLNMQKLREKASKEKLLPIEELANSLKVAELIFLPGLSTSRSISEVSGRGIGMDAVKRFLESEGGHIILELGPELDNFSAFCLNIFLPSSSYIQYEQESKLA